jgi:putative membrane-bound dehydrogenase-like protein
MTPKQIQSVVLSATLLALLSFSVAHAQEKSKATGQQPKVEAQPLSPLRLEKGDHICLIGNELGERMQHHDWFETALHQTFADHNLTVRNLCFPGDEPFERIRSKNFGNPDSHLAFSKASVVLMFFGFNESFDGEKGLGKFETELRKLIAQTKEQDYNTDGNAARLVLVSPIAFQNLRDRNLPDGVEHNERLAMYTETMEKVATEAKVGFADIFNPTMELFSGTEDRLTLNGSHLNDAGYKALSGILIKGLFEKELPEFDLQIKSEVADKNFHWWHRYRACNGFNIYGDRGKAGRDGSGTYNNRDVLERERAILDQMVVNREERIWKMAKGQEVVGKVDDSKTLPFLNPKTNVGLPNDPNKKRGKLGSLEYLSAEEQLKLFKMAPGYEINLVASEEDFPELANPVSMNFDNKGRLWVSTMQSYPNWKPKDKMDDKLLIFEDDNKDGKADRCKVFAGGLHQPTGFEMGHNGVYVAQQPDILFLQDTDGDDQEDTRIRKLTGFDSADSHHGIAAFIWGPGGNLYFQEGTFKFSQVESPYGLTRMREAGIWKYDPRTEKFGSHVSFTFSNPWGHVFDRWGQDFIGDASNGFGYWAAPISGHIEYPLKHPGGSHDGRVQKYVGKEKGYKFNRFYKKRTRPLAGCEIVSSSHFPDEAQGNWLVTNCIGDRMVLSHKIEEKESGFFGKEVDPIVSCEDGNFRPVDVEFAPDGSLYIIDWHNALIGHLQHNLRDPSRDSSHGRIWRVTYKGRPLVTPPKIDGAPVADLLELLKTKEDRTRYRVKRELHQLPTKDVIASLETWLTGLDANDAEYEHHLLEGLWLKQAHNQVDRDLLGRLLAAKDHRARAAAVRVLSFWVDQVAEPVKLLTKLVGDDHPRVRLEAVRALSFTKGDEAIEAALGVLEHEMDYYLQYTLDETMRALEN